VELDEGPRALVRMDEDYDSLAIGDRVELRPVAYDGGADRRRLADCPCLRGFSI
jgi:uncharacterized OB-fold protein